MDRFGYNKALGYFGGIIGRDELANASRVTLALVDVVVVANS